MNSTRRPLRFFRSSPFFALPAGVLAPVMLGALSCGDPPAANAPPKAAVAVAAAPAAAEVSPVPEPTGLVLLGRLRKPGESLKVASGWAHTDLAKPEDVAQLVTGEPVAGLLDLDQPIDFVVQGAAHGLGFRSHTAFAAAVPSLDAARAALAPRKLTPRGDGAFTIEGLGAAPAGGDDDEGGAHRACELLAAAGSAPLRIVCGDSDASLDALAPYLARTAPRASFPSDVHLELRLEPVRPLVTAARGVLPVMLKQVLGLQSTGVPGADDAVEAAFNDLADFALDAEKLFVDASLAESQAKATVRATFRSTTSFLTRVAVAHPERAGAPPATFGRLPADADSAYFHGAVDAKDWEPVRDRLGALVEGVVSKQGLASEADRRALRDVAAQTASLLVGAGVFAKGEDDAAIQKATAALNAVAKGADGARADAERALMEQSFGWSIAGFEEEPAKVNALVKAWLAAWSRPAVAKWLKAQAGHLAAPTLTSAAYPKDLPASKDAAHLVVSFVPPSREDSTKAALLRAARLHLLVVPDATRSWLVLAGDEAAAVAKAKGLLSGKPEETLAQRGGLDGVRNASMNAGGFGSPRGLSEGLLLSWLFEGHHADGRFPPLPQTPAATTPIPVTWVAEPPSPEAAGGAASLSVTVPSVAIDELMRLAARRFGGAGR